MIRIGGMIEHRNAEGFASALRRLLSSEELRRDLGNNARKMIMREFTWERISEDLLKCVR